MRCVAPLGRALQRMPRRAQGCSRESPCQSATCRGCGSIRKDGPLSMTETVLSVAQVVPCTEAEGPGRRFALWFQGCPLRCPGCCNPEMLPFAGGRQMPLAEVLGQVDAASVE